MNIEVTHGHRIAWQNRNWGAKNVLLQGSPHWDFLFPSTGTIRDRLTEISFSPGQEQHTSETSKYCPAQFPFMSTVYGHTDLFVPEFLALTE